MPILLSHSIASRASLDVRHSSDVYPINLSVPVWFTFFA